MSAEQINGITDEQKSALSPEQKEIVMGIETATFGYSSGLYNGNYRSSEQAAKPCYKDFRIIWVFYKGLRII